jgi:hypothetical protein
MYFITYDYDGKFSINNRKKDMVITLVSTRWMLSKNSRKFLHNNTTRISNSFLEITRFTYCSDK